MNFRAVPIYIITCVALAWEPTCVAETGQARVLVHAESLNDGRVDPRLFGNFVELLDDVAPGLWAEMLNDRTFAGVKPMFSDFYHDGTPNFCDREWEAETGLAYDSENE